MVQRINNERSCAQREREREREGAGIPEDVGGTLASKGLARFVGLRNFSRQSVATAAENEEGNARYANRVSHR